MVMSSIARVAVFTAVLLLGLRPAAAGPLVINMGGTTDPDPTVVGWKATVISGGQTVSGVWVPTTLTNGKFPNGKPFPNGGNQGTLNLIVQFTTLKPLVIEFDQQTFHDYGGEGTNADLFNGPLRFTLNESIVNQTTANWPGFRVTIADNDIAPPDANGNQLHPVAAHFHPDKTGNYSPYTYLNPATPNVTKMLDFGNGVVSSGGGSFNLSNLLVHDVEVTNDVNKEELLRSFIITETPVPEPASAVLSTAGAALLLAYRRRVRRSERPSR